MFINIMNIIVSFLTSPISNRDWYTTTFHIVGDWHCAYVLLYGPRVLEVENEPKITSESGDKKSDTVEAMETEPST